MQWSSHIENGTFSFSARCFSKLHLILTLLLDESLMEAAKVLQWNDLPFQQRKTKSDHSHFGQICSKVSCWMLQILVIPKNNKMARILIYILYIVLISSGLENLQILWCLTKAEKLEFLIFHSRNSHRQSTRKRWQNRSRRNWAQMASSANNNAMQKGKDFLKVKNYFGRAYLGRIKSSKVCYVPFFPIDFS